MKRLCLFSVILLLVLSCAKENAPADSTPAPLPVPEAVDMGFGVKWASFNLGASKPQESGRYFAWADVTGQTWDGSNWSGGGFYNSIPYELDMAGNLMPQYDAAHVLLGDKWRMPTKAEQEALLSNCTSVWTSDYNGTGVAGRIFTSKKNGNSIFFPAAGAGSQSGLYSVSSGYHWSGTLDAGTNSWCLYTYSGIPYVDKSNRKDGLPVRPVSE